MKKEILKKHFQLVSSFLTSPLLSRTHFQQSPSGQTRGSRDNIALLFDLDFGRNVGNSSSGAARPPRCRFVNEETSDSVVAECYKSNASPRMTEKKIGPENDGAKNRVKAENDSNKIVFENDNMGRLGGGNMKRIFSAAVLTLFLVLFLSNVANAACSPVDCAALGYTKTEAVCNGSSTIRCPFDVSEVNCVEKALNCSVGDIFYSDNTCDSNIIVGKTPIGVVAYVTDGGRHGGVIALEKKGLYWGEEFDKDLSCLQNFATAEKAAADMNGKINTQCILSQTGSFPAAEYCNNYKPVKSVKGSTDWYLPAAGELKMTSYYYNVLNNSLQRLSNAELLSSTSNTYNTYNCSSSEYDGWRTWNVRISVGLMNAANNNGKVNLCLVRCMLGF